MLRLILGRAGTGKSKLIFDKVCRQCGASGQGRRILLVPEQASHEAERGLCQVGGDSISLYAEVLSFTRLASRVLSAAGGLARPTLDAGGRLLLMHTALQSLSAHLKVYSRPSDKPAFLSSLLDTVDELKSYCVSPLALERAAGGLEGAEGDRLRELALICGAYEALTARSALDPRDRITLLSEKLGESGWAEGMEIYVYGFTDFTPSERQVLRGLISQADSVTVALTCDRLREDEEGIGHFSTARRTAAQLMRMAKELGVPAEVDTLDKSVSARPPALDFLERNLLGLGGVTFSDEAGEIKLLSARSPRAEVEWAAASILELVREKGYRFREIAVCARGFEVYSDIVETVFSRYGVPVFVSAMRDILQKPILALVSAALDTITGGYAYDDVFRYLKTGLTGLPPGDCDLLENYVIKWNIRGSRWTSRQDWALHPRGFGYTMADDDTALLERLNTMRKQVTAPLERLKKNNNKTGAGQAKALYTFLEEITLPARLDERTKVLRGEGELTLAQEYEQLWGILCGALEQCALLLGDMPMELGEFSKLFQMVLSQYDVGTIPVSLDRVTAGEAPRIANRKIRALFLLGAHDGAIPQVSSSPGLLSDEDRFFLAEHGLELAPRTEERLYREMSILYTACTQPTERLAVSWPSAGSEGEERRPSLLVRRLKAMYPNLKTEREDDAEDFVRLAAPRPALEMAARRPDVRAVLERLPEYEKELKRLERAARWERGSLSPRAAERLYGTRVPMSASRMDCYKSCHFSYFMRYGLGAKPRQSAVFSAPEYGTFVHYVLEHVFRQAKKGEDRARLKRLTREAVEQYVSDVLGGLEEQTPRFRYLFGRLIPSVYQVVENVAEELDVSLFTPLAFELGFGERGELPPVESTADDVTVSISGFVDRVDGYVKGDKLYLRVVDYKTGRKSFDLTEIWNGIGLQMLLYLFTLEEAGRALYDREIVPAGVLYLPARDALISGSRGMDEEERRRAVDQELRRRGLLLDDPEVLAAMEQPGERGTRFLPVRVSARTGQITGESLVNAQRMGRLGAHIQRVLEEICSELAAGNIAADPFWRGPEKNACLYCEYAAACHFEEGVGGDKKRWFPTVSAKAFWARLEGTDEAESISSKE